MVYAAAGCAVAEKTFTEATATPEDAPVSLFHDSPYAISKLVGEMYANYFFLRYHLPVVKTRFQNIYGPREILGAGQWRGTSHTVWRNVMPTFIWKALHKEALPLENGGEASRDFVFVQDLVDGLCRAALSGEPGEVYNLASGQQTRIHELAGLINELSGNETPVELKPARNWDRPACASARPRKQGARSGSRRRRRSVTVSPRPWPGPRTIQGLIGRCIARHQYFLTHPNTSAL